jgi:EmrB/QacA subfamily drug resistance transporter
MTDATTPAPETPLSKAQILGLMALALAVFVIANDFTALSVALPMIETDFGADLTTVQWVINGYAMVFGVLIVTGGRLADLFGRRLVFFIGAVIFAGFSLIAGLAPYIWVLLASRFLMGVGGAMMWPAILGMTYALLPSEKAALAGGVFIGAVGLGNSFGPLIGGFLTDTIGWRWIFFLNLPITAFAIFVTWRTIPKEMSQDGERKIDYGGIAILSAGLLALLLALDQGSDYGWLDARIIGLFIVGMLALTGFFLVEQRIGDRALVPTDILKNREFAAACVATLLMAALFFSALLYLPQLMMKQLNYSAIGAGFGMLPLMGFFALSSFVSGPLYHRLGPKIVVIAGAAALAAGMFLLTDLTDKSTYAALVPGMIMLGIGKGLFNSSVTTSAVTALDKSRSSLAGGILYMCLIGGGGSVGLALSTAIVVGSGSLAEGMSIAFFVDGIFALAGLLVAALFIGGKFDRQRVKGLIHHHHAHA